MSVQTVRGRYRCQECNKPFPADTPTHVEVHVYVKFVMSLSCPNCGSKKLYLGYNLNETEDKLLRIEGTIKARAENWLHNGDCGNSSEAIYKFFTGQLQDHWPIPVDTADLRRCILLLEHVPEWKHRMHEMASIPSWANLAKNWGSLVDLYRSESPDLGVSGPETRAYLELLTASPSQ